MEALVPLFVIGLVVFLVLVTTAASARQQREVDRVLTSGVPAQGIVLEVAATGSRVVAGVQPAERRWVRIEVEVAGQAPYEIAGPLLIPKSVLRSVLPGATLQLRVDPANPRNLAIVAPGLAAIYGGAPAGMVPAPAPVARVAPVRVASSPRAAPVVIGAVLLFGIGGAVAFGLAADSGRDWCKAASSCCKVAGGSVAACNAGKSSEACHRAYDGYKKAAAALGRKCR